MKNTENKILILMEKNGKHISQIYIKPIVNYMKIYQKTL